MVIGAGFVFFTAGVKGLLEPLDMGLDLDLKMDEKLLLLVWEDAESVMSLDFDLDPMIEAKMERMIALRC